MRENTFYKTLTAVSLTAAMSMGSIVPVYGQSTMQRSSKKEIIKQESKCPEIRSRSIRERTLLLT